MSVQAVKWAISVERTGPLPAEARLVLVVMADRADKNGCNVYLSANTMAETLGTSERAVRRHLALLRDQGLILRGDQDILPDYYREDRKPVVYDLPIEAPRRDATVTPWQPSKARARVPDEWIGKAMRDDSNVTPLHPHGVTPVTERGDTSRRYGVTALSPKTLCNPNRSQCASRHHDYLTSVARIVRSIFGQPSNGMMPLRAEWVTA